MLVDIWPIAGLRLTTPLVELRPMTDEDLAALGDLAAAGIHDPATQPFGAEWTDQPLSQIPLGVVQFHWQSRARLKPDNWSIEFGVFIDGRLAGTQGIGAKQFRVLREVHTGSWLGKELQGRGIGTHMRAAVLELAFTGLDAEHAVSEAFSDNAASNAVSRKLGYQPDGITRLVVRGVPVTSQRLRLTRSEWEAHRTIPVQIEGLEACLPLLGAVD
jgi:RimJ/RimL family protein N-acetyltransferase